ncbi:MULTISPECIES: flagellar filament capping protein FliD [Kosakonia]|jgi:flagellar hook-associated protein 2|uniref:Flagellar hook-associated protein 2 n=1 Tax=Kosakonia cowanii JCM 10956 = DSM 18146 TaxID=1300165 RepID=A0A807LKF6_9ENTR|nr:MULTISPECIES: flagellar filament capping protein FliD [Kosakonia]APZ07076.1 flagellar filament capping protein FliD [Kosakonia cowanii JCM 10956 = DSM 18146]MDM9617310.1 flagellar filament capping protein FliD [Kosakonia cowanii]MDP4562449.1 flagellar filament capping protein FliD [Kosakonia cowanii]MDY0887254.1 flagellar filament capping protein FliD [Kosakonia sp. CFBP8986]WPG19347.1 flagellar filament capping protein FliD [Kosakonia cowanii]
MATISSLGAGTSLDLNTLYDNLQTAEQTKLTPIASQQSSYKAKLTAWGVVQTSLNKLQTAADALKNTSAIAGTKVSSTNTAFTATLANTASAGTYSIEVSALAASQSLLSPKVASKDTDLGDQSLDSRTITITQPGQKDPLTVTLDKDKTSLADMRDAINAKQGSVTASIIKADDNSYYLALTSRDSGTTNQMTITTNDAELAKYVSYDSTNTGSASNVMTQQVAASDAKVKINGIDITRSSNKITDAPEGVTLTLNKLTTGTPETLSVTKDNAPMTAAIQAYVDAYNSLQTTIGNQTKYTAVDQGSDKQNTSNGDLLGDGTLRNIQTRLRSQLSTSQAGNDSFSVLSQLGITQDVSGKLTVDSTKLEKAMNEKSADVVTFLSGDGKTTGFATQASNLLKDILGSKGSIQNATDGINKTLKRLDTQYKAVSDQITATMARYKAQFTSLSQLVSSMTSTGNYLTQQFNAMS